jgi:DNA polymerase III subunit alpha
MLVDDLGRRYDARFVATNDVHYINKEDARLQDIMLAIQTGCLLSDPNRMRMTRPVLLPAQPAGDGAPVRKRARSDQQHPADRRALQPGPGLQGLPPAEFDVPEGYTPEPTCAAVRSRPAAPLRRRASDPVVRQRLDYELGVIITRWASTPTS